MNAITTYVGIEKNNDLLDTVIITRDQDPDDDCDTVVFNLCVLQESTGRAVELAGLTAEDLDDLIDALATIQDQD